jgi:hypothetical protein
MWHREFYQQRLARKVLIAIVAGNFLATTFAGLVENVELRRACFVLAGMINLGIATILVRFLTRARKKVLLRADS